MTEHYTIFSTSIGPCALAWQALSKHSTSLPISRLYLPEMGRLAMAMRLAEDPSLLGAERIAPPIADCIRCIQLHLGGQVQDFRIVTLQLDRVSPFARRVYEAARTIPPGQTMTYGQLAQSAGNPGAARAVGTALSKNPIPLIIPCHRIIAAHGKIGGFSAPGGLTTKWKLLKIEGIDLERNFPPNRKNGLEPDLSV